MTLVPEAKHQATFRISAAHPSFPGHFPGHPVVPGVVLLDEVLALAESWQQREVSVRTLQQVKFLTPLLPEQQAEVELTLRDDDLRFTVRRDSETVAQGAFKLATELP